jgi:hypothetical protein
MSSCLGCHGFGSQSTAPHRGGPSSFQFSPREIYGKKVTGNSPNTPAFPRPYHFTIAPCKSPNYTFLLPGEMAEPGCIPQINVLS